MQAKLILIALSAAVAFGQAQTDANIARVFHLRHIDKQQDLNEFATMVRTVAGIPKMSVDFAQRSMSVSGTAAQIATAEWMFTELDRQTLPEFATKEFKVPNKEDDVVRVFFLPHTAKVQDFQEVATAVRTIADIRVVFTYNAPRALAARGTADQIAAVGWMVQELDQPADAKRTDSREYQMIDPGKHGETAVRVYYVPYAVDVRQFQEVATLIRSVAEIRRVFTYNTPRAIVLRGTSEQIAAGGWMIHELGKPVGADAVASAPYPMPDLNRRQETVLRVFYVPDAVTVQALDQVAAQIRATAGIRRLFTYNEAKAIALCGTATEVAMAEQMLKDRAQQVASK